jgi:hypothetical protein
MNVETSIRQRAREMAETRRYRGWRSIETALRGIGVRGVKVALDDAFLRRELDLACQGRSIYDT